MADLKLDLGAAPYFDDHDEEKNYHRILFKPKYAVQARELTQLQTILQDQVSRFGTNILVEGTIVKGGNFTDLRNLAYVKIRDNNLLNQPIVFNNYTDGLQVVGRLTGVEAAIITKSPGLESQTPALNTLYVRYTRSGRNVAGDDVKTFLPGETLQFYLNGVELPELSVAVAPLSADPFPIGVGYAVKCEDGTLFQKGFFINFDPQTVIVSRYDSAPHALVIGFEIEESIINSFMDSSLLDNAAGFPNENAPGADRLKLEPKLVVKSLEEAEAEQNFFAIQEYQEGRLIRRKVDTQFNSINRTLKRRTAEESGNYIVDGMSVSMSASKNGSENLVAAVSAGIAYVEGERVEILSTLAVEIAKGTEFGTVQQQSIVSNYGSYIELSNVVGHFPSNVIYQVNFRDAVHGTTSLSESVGAGAVIGSAYVRAVKKVGTTVRLYLFNILMAAGRNLSQMRSVTYQASTARADVPNPVIRDASFRGLLFSIGETAIRQIDTQNSDYTYNHTFTTTANTTGGFQLSLNSEDTWPYGASATLNSDQLSGIYATVEANGQMISLTSGSTDSSSTSLILDSPATFPGTTNVRVSVPIKRNAVSPTGKELLTVYVRINPTGNLTGPYSLGLPDVYKIDNVWRGTNDTFTSATAGVVDVSNLFKLNKNQQDTHYGLSSVTPTAPVTAGQRFLVKLKVFRKLTSGDYSQSFFTVNSYPVNDTSLVLPENAIRTEDIPSFVGPNGATYDLRDTIDFRPYATPRAAYATTPAAATIWTLAAPLDALAFPDTTYLSGPGETLEVDYSYYLARRDRLVIDEVGNFNNMKGVASNDPRIPPPPRKGMTLATIYIPPFPSLPSNLAHRALKPQYAVSVSKEDNRRYTMRDIGDIAKRMDRIEYYTVLSSLEKSAEDMVVTDEQGLTRFKNGILVDSFSNLLVADTRSDAFNASVDPGESVLAPAFHRYSLEMKPLSWTGIKNNDDEVMSLTHSRVRVIHQPYATSFRNCVTDFYSFKGTVWSNPSYDSGYEETIAPDINIDVDLATPFIEYTKNLNKYVPLTSATSTSTSSSKNSTTSTTKNATTTAGTTRTTTAVTTKVTDITTKTITDSMRVGIGSSKVSKVGEFVTDVSFQPFMRANTIKVRVIGLRPNTTHYVFFDGENVDKYTATGRVPASGKIKDMVRVSAFGPTVKKVSAANGILDFYFAIPAGKFFVGDRELLVIDVNDLNSTEAATSSAKFTYRGFNYSVEKTGLEVTTRLPSFSNARTVTTANRTVVSSTSKTTSVFKPAPPPPPDPEVVDPLPEIPDPKTPPRRTWAPEPGEGGGGSDPIAQTFMVTSQMTKDNVMMVSGLNLFFQAKSATHGITVQIRDVENGFPGQRILPWSSVHLTAAEVLVSPAGGVATAVNFPVPVTLSVEQEYCIVIIPDGNSPDYRIWIARTGEKDRLTSFAVTQDVNNGTLFTSTNNRAWTPHQDENMKFSVFKTVFNNSRGQVTFGVKDYEFLRLNPGMGTFQRGETVFAKRPLEPGTVRTTNGESEIIGTNTGFTTTLAIGDTVTVEYTDGDFLVAKVVTVNSPYSVTINEVAKRTSTGARYYKTVAGIMDYQDRGRDRLHLKNSSAAAGNIFTVGDDIVGEVSGAVGQIAEVLNLPVSYIQNNYYRTNFNRTGTELVYTTLRDKDGANLVGSNRPGSFGGNDYFNEGEVRIFSKSNGPTTPSFRASVTLFTDGSLPADASPILDHDISSTVVYEYEINNDSTGENKDIGNAESRYLTKVVELAEGLDAETLKVWLTAYRPTGTDIKMYAKVRAGDDSTNFEDIDWIELTRLDKTSFVSSLTNRNDFREFEFELPSQATAFKFYSVKIVMLSTAKNRIPKIKDMRAIALT